MKLKLIVTLLILSYPLNLQAQTATAGSVVGTITDTSGAVIGNAGLQITQTTTNLTQKTVTNAAGQYGPRAIQLSLRLEF